MFHALSSGSVQITGYALETHLHDVETLNQHAMRGTFDISKLSFHAWSKAARNVAWRQDYDHAMGLPINYLTKLAEDLSAAGETNKLVGSIFTEGLYNNWASMGLVYYTLGRFFWNGDVDAEALLDDYCRSGFGRAAPAVKRYFNQLEKITDEICERNDTSWRWQEGVLQTAIGFYPDRIPQLRALLDEARELAAGDADALARIDFLQISLDYADIQLKLWTLYFKDQLTDAEIRRGRELLAERLAFFRKNRASFALSGGWVLAKEGIDEKSPLVRKFGWKYPTK